MCWRHLKDTRTGRSLREDDDVSGSASHLDFRRTIMSLVSLLHALVRFSNCLKIVIITFYDGFMLNYTLSRVRYPRTNNNKTFDFSG
jgi:hypothetical protein